MRLHRFIALALVVALLSVSLQHAASALAISYPAGWNIVAGPSGSTLVGASGSIYALQPGDSNYRTLPATTPLTTGWGYWAYFASGGSVKTAPGSNSFTATLTAGQYVLLGNPSAASPATVTGADSVLTYTPGGDYTSGATIPAGQGAWVTGSGTVTITVAAAAAPPTQAQPPAATAAPPVATPAPQPQPLAAPALPTTSAGLKAVALNQSDLPGYSLFSEDSPNLPGANASYHAAWSPSLQSSPILLVQNSLVATGSLSVASGLVQSFPASISNEADVSNVHLLASSAIGDEESAVSSTHVVNGTPYDDYSIFFRRGTVFVWIDITSAPGTGNVASITAYAQAIDSRLSGGAPAASAPATTASAPAATAPSGHLFQASGSGDGDTVDFTLPTSGANVCVQVSGQSPSGTFGPDASLFVYQADGSIDGTVGDFTTSSCKITHPIDGPGRYYIDVVATSWTSWSITVDAE